MSSKRAGLGVALVATLLVTSACSFADPETADVVYPPLWQLPGGHGYLAVARDLSLVAVSLERGRLWSYKPSKDTDSLYGHTQHVVCTPFFLHDGVIVRTETELVILDTATGKLRYRARAERETRFGAKGCPMPAGDDAYLVTAEGGRRLRKVRPNGDDIWNIELPNGAVAIGPPRATGSGEVVVRAGDRLVVWDASGVFKWTKPLADYEE